MKSLLTGIFTIAMALGAMAEVPSLINYQGKLSDKSGNPVNGTKNFTVRIFDAKEGGKEIYKEQIGSLAVKDGLYSFGFGEVGKSVVTPTEVLARADGEKQVFNYITKHKPILGNVNISGGGLSWTDDDGSSDASKFTSTINKNSGAASAIFLTKAPDAGTEVSISYDHNSDGVMGALSRGGQSWLEITVESESLVPRERLVTVPYALRSGEADSVRNPPIIPVVVRSDNWSGGIHDKWHDKKDYYLLPGANGQKLKFIMSFYPQTSNNRGGTVRMYIKLMKRDINDENFKVVAEKYSQNYSDSKFYYNQILELNNKSVSGHCLIEFGIENVSDSNTNLKILDYMLLLQN